MTGQHPNSSLTSVDLETHTTATGNSIQREKSLENSQAPSTEFNHASPSAKLTNDEDTLSRIESATSAVYDPASRVPTNASRESGIIGILSATRLILTMFVGWDGENDPLNPRNWVTWRKVVVIGFVATITFFSPLASSMFAPGIPSVMKTFNTTNESLGTFCVSVYILVFSHFVQRG